MIEIIFCILLVVSWSVLGGRMYVMYKRFYRHLFNCRKEINQVLDLEDKILEQTKKLLKGEK